MGVQRVRCEEGHQTTCSRGSCQLALDQRLDVEVRATGFGDDRRELFIGQTGQVLDYCCTVHRFNLSRRAAVRAIISDLCRASGSWLVLGLDGQAGEIVDVDGLIVAVPLGQQCLELLKRTTQADLARFWTGGHAWVLSDSIAA